MKTEVLEGKLTELFLLAFGDIEKIKTLLGNVKVRSIPSLRYLRIDSNLHQRTKIQSLGGKGFERLKHNRSLVDTPCRDHIRQNRPDQRTVCAAPSPFHRRNENGIAFTSVRLDFPNLDGFVRHSRFGGGKSDFRGFRGVFTGHDSN